MSNWKVVPLSNAVTQMKTGSTPPTAHPEFFGGDIPWFTPGDIGSTQKLISSTRTITQEAISAGEAKLFEKDVLLVTCIGDVGRVGVLQQPSYSNQQITALKFKDEIDSEFAYYWFVSNKQRLVNLANQAIVPILNNERLSEIEFAYPPLTEQKRIASLLRRADRLRRLRRTASELGDALLQSVFLGMFGNPRTNSRNWDMCIID
ncbi:MAG: restriction endonuclease subunit S, partial [Anaerolineales bacterium]